MKSWTIESLGQQNYGTAAISPFLRSRRRVGGRVSSQQQAQAVAARQTAERRLRAGSPCFERWAGAVCPAGYEDGGASNGSRLCCPNGYVACQSAAAASCDAAHPDYFEGGPQARSWIACFESQGEICDDVFSRAKVGPPITPQIPSQIGPGAAYAAPAVASAASYAVPVATAMQGLDGSCGWCNAWRDAAKNTQAVGQLSKNPVMEFLNKNPILGYLALAAFAGFIGYGLNARKQK